MHIAAFVNGIHLCTAGIVGNGYLGAHLNVALRSNRGESEQQLQLSGIETRDTQSTYINWPSAALKTGDEVTLRLVEAGASTEPASTQLGAEVPTNLISSEKLAAELLSACADFDARLLHLLAQAEIMESQEEHAKLLRAVGEVSAALGERLLYPVYRRHPMLVPEQLRGEIL